MSTESRKIRGVRTECSKQTGTNESDKMGDKYRRKTMTETEYCIVVQYKAEKWYEIILQLVVVTNPPSPLVWCKSTSFWEHEGGRGGTGRTGPRQSSAPSMAIEVGGRTARATPPRAPVRSIPPHAPLMSSAGYSWARGQRLLWQKCWYPSTRMISTGFSRGKLCITRELNGK